MTTQGMSAASYQRDMGDGLRLRWSTAADAEAIGQLYGYVFRSAEDAPLNQTLIAWQRDLISGKHPLLGAGDFALVEDTARGVIVAATCLMRQTWQYDGIAFPVGRPEIVASLPEYRNRGLVRAIFGLIHARSDGREDLAQGITGIPYYYRQFGYEYALDLDGSRSVYFAAIPRLKDGQPEPYTLRPASEADIPQLIVLYDRDRARGPVSAVVDATYWRWNMDPQRDASREGWNSYMITDRDGRSIGYVLFRRQRWGDAIPVSGVALEPGIALPSVLPSVLRGIQAQTDQIPAAKPDTPAAVRIAFSLFGAHPLYDALGTDMTAAIHPPYAWYVRVPDLLVLLRRVAPALDARLAASSMAGYTGELKIDFYRGGLRVAFEAGRLATAEHWQRERWQSQAQAGCPPLVFLQLLFGHRSLAQLRDAFPDVWADDTARVLLNALFPARLSWVIPLD